MTEDGEPETELPTGGDLVVPVGLGPDPGDDAAVIPPDELPAADPTIPTAHRVGAPLSELLPKLGVRPGEYDLMIVADGSGSGWNVAGGWAAVVIDLVNRRRKLLTGATSAATSSTMELMPFVWATFWYHNQLPRSRSGKIQVAHPVRVLCVSDSWETCKLGNEGHQGGTFTSPLWAALRCAQRESGMVLMKWVWAERDSIGLNVLCDHLSRVSRVRHHEHVSLVRAYPNLFPDAPPLPPKKKKKRGKQATPEDVLAESDPPPPPPLGREGFTVYHVNPD